MLNRLIGVLKFLVVLMMLPVLLLMVVMSWVTQRWPPKPGPAEPTGEIEAERRGEAGGAEPVWDFKRIYGRMKSMTQPTLLLTATEAPGFSKLGGEPMLPEGVEWPVEGTKSTPFLLQVDLAEAAAAGGPKWLPAAGALWAFHTPGRGEVEVSVLHAAPGPRRKVEFPITLDRKQRYGERAIAFEKRNSAPDLEAMGLDDDEIEVTDSQQERLEEMSEIAPADGLEHRIGGYASQIQSGNLPLECEHRARGLTLDYRKPVAPEIAAAAKTWRLLFQIDDDPELDMEWGDSGRLYVFVREADARAGDFSKTVTIFQCH